jgi:hypothetical protein
MNKIDTTTTDIDIIDELRQRIEIIERKTKANLKNERKGNMSF